MKELLRKLTLAGIVSIAFSSIGFAQGYQIDLTLDGSENENILLGYYLYGKTYVKDTAGYSGSGKYTFAGETPLDKGMYFIARNTSLLFDLVIGDDQQFEIQTKTEDFLPSMKVVGDLDNQLFYENMKFNLDCQKEGAPYMEVIQDSTTTMENKEAAAGEIDAINDKVFAYQDKIMAEYPESILATLFKSGKQVEIPKELEADESEGSRTRKYRYYKNHFWDNFDLGNPVMLRLPNTIYIEKVDNYLDRLTHPNPDSVKVGVDVIGKMASKNPDTYQYVMWYLTIKYQTSKIMGLDEVYVHIVDNYFMTGEMDFWANDQLKNNLKEQAEKYRNSLVGMVAPNLILQDLERQPKALHDISNKYTVIYFYDPDCGHCKKETPVLKEIVETTSFDVGVYTVSADTSMTKMGDYIEEMGLQSWTNTNGTRTYGIRYQDVYDAYTTPTIYLLDENKKIIAKKITAKQLDEAISNFEKTVESVGN